MSSWLTSELIELAEKARKKLANEKDKEDWIAQEVASFTENINKPVGTNFHLFTNIIREKIQNRQNQEKIIGFEIEFAGDSQIHWLQYLDKKK